MDMPGTYLRAAVRPQLRGRDELPLLDLSQEQRERAGKEGAGIAVRDLPAEQVLEASELSLGLRADRELYASSGSLGSGPRPKARPAAPTRALRRRIPRHRGSARAASG